jgi:hypothetical protein
VECIAPVQPATDTATAPNATMNARSVTPPAPALHTCPHI